MLQFMGLQRVRHDLMAELNEVDETGAYYTERRSQKEKHQYSMLMHIYGI